MTLEELLKDRPNTTYVQGLPKRWVDHEGILHEEEQPYPATGRIEFGTLSDARNFEHDWQKAFDINRLGMALYIREKA